MAPEKKTNKPTIKFIDEIYKQENYFVVEDFTREDKLGSLFHIKAVISLTKEAIEDKSFDAYKLVGSKVVFGLPILSSGQSRYSTGYVSEMKRKNDEGEAKEGEKKETVSYEITVVPLLYFRTKTIDCNVFQGKDVQEIITSVLVDKCGWKVGEDFEFRLKETYPKRDYCIQYKETYFDFISRLMEEEGIYYFFKHTLDGSKVIFTDSNDKAEPFTGYKDIPFKKKSREDEQQILKFHKISKVVSGHFTSTGYNYEFSTDNYLASDIATTNPKLPEVMSKLKNYEPLGYSNYVKDKSDDGKRYPKIRREALTAEYEVFEGEATAGGIAVGAVFTLSNYKDPYNIKYLVTETTITKTSEEEQKSKKAPLCRIAFKAIDARIQFRLPIKTSCPNVPCLTAEVVGPQGKKFYSDADDTDSKIKLGRIKIQFHWDRFGKKNETSSCWVRVAQPLAGNGWGCQYIPRPGMEVIVGFEGGNIDMPIVVGTLYNDKMKPPLEEKKDFTKTVLLKTVDENDKPGTSIIVDDSSVGDKKHSLTITEAGNMITTVNKGTHELTVKEGNSILIVEKGNHNMVVGGKRTSDLKGNDIYICDGDKASTVKGKRTEEVGTDYNVSVKGQAVKEVTETDATKAKNFSVVCEGGKIYLKAKDIVIEGDVSITGKLNHKGDAALEGLFSTKKGSNFMVVNDDGAYMQGKKAAINSGSPAGLEGATFTNIDSAFSDEAIKEAEQDQQDNPIVSAQKKASEEAEKLKAKASALADGGMEAVMGIPLAMTPPPNTALYKDSLFATMPGVRPVSGDLRKRQSDMMTLIAVGQLGMMGANAAINPLSDKLTQGAAALSQRGSDALKGAISNSPLGKMFGDLSSAMNVPLAMVGTLMKAGIPQFPALQITNVLSSAALNPPASGPFASMLFVGGDDFGRSAATNALARLYQQKGDVDCFTKPITLGNFNRTQREFGNFEDNLRDASYPFPGMLIPGVNPMDPSLCVYSGTNDMHDQVNSVFNNPNPSSDTLANLKSSFGLPSSLQTIFF